jgi:hypothetical protein
MPSGMLVYYKALIIRSVEGCCGGRGDPRCEHQAAAARLRRYGLQLIARRAQDFELAAYPDLLMKDNYWRWPQHELGPTDQMVCLVGGESELEAES